MPENTGGLVKTGEEFMNSMGWRIADNGALKDGGITDKRRHTKVMEKWAQLEKVGWEKITVINCLPFALELQTNYGYFNIRGCDVAKGEPYFAFNFDKPFMSMSDEGDGKMIPEPVLPVEIGMEFERVYEESGGVVMYNRGKRGEDLPTEGIIALVKNARGRMVVWMTAMYEKGNNDWQRYNKQPRRIEPQCRQAAHFLFQMGIIDQLPEWVHITKATAGTKMCPHCGESIKTAAKICRYCGLLTEVALEAQLESGHKVRTSAPEPEPPLGSTGPFVSGHEATAQPGASEDGGPSDEELLGGEAEGQAGKTLTKPPKDKGKK